LEGGGDKKKQERKIVSKMKEQRERISRSGSYPTSLGP